MHDFRKRQIWNEAMDLAELVYHLTREFPNTERFGLTAQLRSAAVSVSSNIAEAAGRGGLKDMARFLRTAMGSLAEVDSQIELAARLGLIERDPAFLAKVQILGGKIRRLHNQLMEGGPQNHSP